MKQLQSLCRSLAFCTRALPAGRVFCRRLYLATAKAKKPLHLNKVTNEMYEDLLMLKYFVEQFNGNSFIFDNWISNCDLELYTDSVGGAALPLDVVPIVKINGLTCTGLLNGKVLIFR